MGKRIAAPRKLRQERKKIVIHYLQPEIWFMAHTFSHLLTHIIFSTKDRQPFLDAALKSRLFPYLGGIIRAHDGKALIINGPTDHIHILASLAAKHSLANLMRELKADSSGWIHKTFPNQKSFSWQIGYAAFSVSHSNLPEVEKYIADQEEHHRKMSFQEEFIAFLKKHEIPYDDRFLWDWTSCRPKRDLLDLSEQIPIASAMGYYHTLLRS
jgi:putative transposase